MFKKEIIKFIWKVISRLKVQKESKRLNVSVKKIGLRIKSLKSSWILLLFISEIRKDWEILEGFPRVISSGRGQWKPRRLFCSLFYRNWSSKKGWKDNLLKKISVNLPGKKLTITILIKKNRKSIN